MSWKQQEGNFEDRSDQCIRFCRKGHNGKRPELLDFAFQKAHHLFQSICSKIQGRSSEYRGLRGGSRGGGTASVDVLLKGKEIAGGVSYALCKVGKPSAFVQDGGKESVARGCLKIWEREEPASGPRSQRQGANNKSGT